MRTRGMRQAGRSLLAAATGAAVAHWGLRTARALGSPRTDGGAQPPASRLHGAFAADRWTRTNHRGEPVTLLEGPVYAVAAAAGVLAAPALPGRLRVAGATSALGAGAFGVYDDLCGNGDRRGMRGHINALMKQGEVTTGAVKLAGIGTVGLLGGCLVRRGSVIDKALAAVLIAGAANAVNLLDLRPGRAIKGATFAAVPGLLRRAAFGVPGVSTSADIPAGAANTLAFAALGSAAALLPEDLGERAMLGDAGANALGALLGTAAAAGARGTAGLAWRAAAMTAVTLASEKISFTKVIAANPTLDALDRWGRRPPAPSSAAADQGSVSPVGLPPTPPSASAAEPTPRG